jgi:hypothetical protein
MKTILALAVMLLVCSSADAGGRRNNAPRRNGNFNAGFNAGLRAANGNGHCNNGAFNAGFNRGLNAGRFNNGFNGGGGRNVQFGLINFGRR